MGISPSKQKKYHKLKSEEQVTHSDFYEPESEEQQLNIVTGDYAEKENVLGGNQQQEEEESVHLEEEDESNNHASNDKNESDGEDETNNEQVEQDESDDHDEDSNNEEEVTIETENQQFEPEEENGEEEEDMLPLSELIEALLNGKIEIEVPSQVHIVKKFTNSTFEDALLERKTLVLKVYPKLKEYCQSGGLDFQVADMKWTVYDESAADETTSELCTRGLKPCQKLATGPNFITCLAQKYGYRPFPSKINSAEFEKLLAEVKNEEDVSLLNKWFCKDMNLVPAMHVLQPITDILPHYNNQNVRKKDRSTASNQWWTDFERMQVVLHEAALKCFNQSSMWKNFGRKEQDIDDRLIQEISQHVETCQLKSKIFHGRESELREVEKYLEKESDEEDMSPLVIHGPSGSGKTALMAKIAKLTKEKYPDDLVIFRFLGTTADSSTIFKVLNSVCSQILRVHENSLDRPGPIPKTFKALYEYFAKLLSNAKDNSIKIFVILDSIDQLSTDDGAHVMKWLPKVFASNIKIIISTLPDEKYGILTNLKVFLPSSIFIHVSTLPDDIASDIFQAWLKDSNHQLTSEQLSLVMDSFKKCPLPIFLKLLFEETLRWKFYSPFYRLVLKENIKDSIESFFIHLERLHGERLVQHSLGLITASKHGLSDAELDEILSIDDEVLNDVYQYWTPPARKIPPLLWIRVRTDLDSYMVTRGESGVLVNNWYHQQFIEAATEQYLQLEDKLNYHKLLAEYFLGTWSESRKKPYATKSGEKLEADRLLSSQPNVYSSKGADEIYNFRRLSELPRHLIIMGDADQVKKEIFYNFDFLLVKLKALGYQYLFEDSLEARARFPKDKDIKLMHEFFKMTARVLTAAPDQLSTQLIGRLINQEQNEYLSKLLHDAKSNGNKCFYPSQQCFDAPGGPLVQVLAGHTQMINHISVTEDKTKLLSVSMDSTLKIWDLEDGSMIKSIDLENFGNMVFPFQDDTCAILCSYSHVTSIDLTTEKLYYSEYHNTGNGNTCAVSTDKKYFVVGSSEEFTTFNIEDKVLKVIYTYKNTHEKDPSVQMYATDLVAGGISHYAFTVGIPNKIFIRSYADQNYETEINLPASFMFFTFTPDGEKLCVLGTTSSRNRSNKAVSLFIYSAFDFALLKELKSADSHMIVQVYSAQIYTTNDGLELLWPTLSELNFWNIENSKQKKAMKSGYQGVQHKQGLVCNDLLLLTRLDQNTTSIQAYDMDTITYSHVDQNAPMKSDREVVRDWASKGDRDLFMDPTDLWIAYSISTMDPKISMWNIHKEELVKDINFEGIFPTAVMPIGGKTILLWDHNRRSILVYDTEMGSIKHTIEEICDSPPSIFSWVYIQDTQEVVVMDTTKKLFKFFKLNGELAGEIQTEFEGDIQPLIVNADGGRCIVSESYNGIGKQSPTLVIDTINRRILCKLTIEEHFLMSPAADSFSSDGCYYVYTGEGTQEFHIWNVDGNKLEKMISYEVTDGLKGIVIALVISSKQNYIAVNYKSFAQIGGDTYEPCYILVAYQVGSWEKRHEVLMAGMATQMSVSNDETRLLATIQADNNKLKAFVLYDFSPFSTTGKFELYAELCVDVNTRFCYLSKDGAKLCIGLADLAGITFMNLCGGGSDSSSDTTHDEIIDSQSCGVVTTP